MHAPAPLSAQATSARALRRGLTLIDMLATLAVTLVTLAASAPGMRNLIERRHVEGAAALLEGDLMHARSQAVAHMRTLRVSFARHPLASCYAIHSGAADACSCTATGVQCLPGTVVLREQHYAAGGGVSIQSNVRSMVLEPLRGTVTPTASIQVLGREGRSVRVIVNLAGRVRSCMPAPAWSGHRRCT